MFYFAVRLHVLTWRTMKTPTKQKSNVGESSSPAQRQYYKRFELLVVFCGPSREDVVGAPDVGILPCAVPGSSLETTRVGQHLTEAKILELVSAQTYDGVLIDSIFDTGVEMSREACDCGPVVGTFLPSVHQAALVGGKFALLVVNAFENGEQAAQHLLRDLAVKHGVAERMAGVQCLANSSIPRGEEAVANHLADACVALAKRCNADSVVLAGACVPTMNALLRGRGEQLVVIDATLAGLNAVDGMMRQNLRPSRRLFPKTASLKNLF